MGHYRGLSEDTLEWPFSHVPQLSNGEENPTLKYIGCLRIKPNVIINEEGKIENLELSIYDTYHNHPDLENMVDSNFIGKYSLIPSDSDDLILTY
jgi:hypothetical protein